MKPDLLRVVMTYPRFEAYVKPQGFLCREKECHACFYYAAIARRAYEEVNLGFAIEYEDTQSQQTNFKQQIESVCLLYGIRITDLVKHWKCSDMQYHALGLPVIPDEERYRFNRTPEVKLN